LQNKEVRLKKSTAVILAVWTADSFLFGLSFGSNSIAISTGHQTTLICCFFKNIFFLQNMKHQQSEKSFAEQISIYTL